MRERDGRLHRPAQWIEWAEAHGAHHVLYGHFRLARPNSHPAAGIPRDDQVGVKRESPIYQGNTIIIIADDVSKRVSGLAERNSIILA